VQVFSAEVGGMEEQRQAAREVSLVEPYSRCSTMVNRWSECKEKRISAMFCHTTDGKKSKSV
jgi:hypothetical protein